MYDINIYIITSSFIISYKLMVDDEKVSYLLNYIFIISFSVKL